MPLWLVLGIVSLVLWMRDEPGSVRQPQFTGTEGAPMPWLGNPNWGKEHLSGGGYVFTSNPGNYTAGGTANAGLSDQPAGNAFGASGVVVPPGFDDGRMQGGRY